MNKILNYVLIEQKFDESRLSQTDWADLLAINRGTFRKYKKDYTLMPMGTFIQMCRYLGLGIKDVLWYQETSVRLDYLEAREPDCITGREMEMICRDNMSTELELRDYFHITIRYLRKMRPKVCEGEKFCCIPKK